MKTTCVHWDRELRELAGITLGKLVRVNSGVILDNIGLLVHVREIETKDLTW